MSSASAALALLAALALGPARRPEPPRSVAIDLGGGTKLEFVLIPAGAFRMGADDVAAEEDESPVHLVTLTQPFYLGKYEVTQAQWTAVMGDNPSRHRGADLPVDSASWNDCRRFLERLGKRTGRRFALPTEAQWEYAARAGTTTRWSSGDEPDRLDGYAWSAENSGGATHPVGGRRPNPWGLYDTAGNIGEWCADRYAKHAYAGGPVTDPAGPGGVAGDSRVWRGGAWGDNPDYLRPSYRNCTGPAEGHPGIGLRCVMLIEPEP